MPRTIFACSKCGEKCTTRAELLDHYATNKKYHEAIEAKKLADELKE